MMKNSNFNAIRNKLHLHSHFLRSKQPLAQHDATLSIMCARLNPWGINSVVECLICIFQLQASHQKVGFSINPCSNVFAKIQKILVKSPITHFKSYSFVFFLSTFLFYPNKMFFFQKSKIPTHFSCRSLPLNPQMKNRIISSVGQPKWVI